MAQLKYRQLTGPPPYNSFDLDNVVQHAGCSGWLRRFKEQVGELTLKYPPQQGGYGGGYAQAAPMGGSVCGSRAGDADIVSRWTSVVLVSRISVRTIAEHSHSDGACGPWYVESN